MTEQDYFKYFKEEQLCSLDILNGTLDVYVKTSSRSNMNPKTVRYNVGSLNEDGYERVWCGSTTTLNFKPKLFMKHRLIYWLHHNNLGKDSHQIDHIDRVRNNNSIYNLRLVTHKENMGNFKPSSVIKGTYPLSTILYACHLLETTTLSDLIIATQLGLSRNYVRDIKKRRRRSSISVNFQWTHRE